MRINNIYTYKFIKTRNGYLYPVKSGIYLHFNNDLEYAGVEIFIKNMYKGIDNVAYEKLRELISRDFVEVEYE